MVRWKRNADAVVILVTILLATGPVQAMEDDVIADASAKASVTRARTFSWKDMHPEVAAIFPQVSCPTIDWPSESIETGLMKVSQPCLVKEPGEELLVNGHMGQVLRSKDGGRTWSLLAICPAMNPELPEGFQLSTTFYSGGIGVTDKGTILLSWTMDYNHGSPHHSYKDESYHRLCWMTRSEDDGKTWTRTALFDPSPYQVTSDNEAMVIQLRDGRLLVALSVAAWSRPGKPITLSENILRSFIYSSIDDGKTWSNYAKFPDHCPEPHLLELPSGKILASVRYQRRKVAEDPPNLAGCFWDEPSLRHIWEDLSLRNNKDPTAIGLKVFQHTALTSSNDGGRTWTTPRLLTGILAQTSCLARLSDGTLVVVFGRGGQRFMVSYDDGQTWCKAVYLLGDYGEYARSVALQDDTIVTITAPPGYGGQLLVRRWKVPPREEVEKHGFFAPLEVESGQQ